MIKNFVWEYRNLLVLAAIFICYVIYLVVTHKVKETVLGLMLQAERMAKAKILQSGQPQEDWVYDQLKLFFPKYTALIGEERIRKLIKYLFQKAKDLLDDGRLNNSTV